MKFFDKLNVLTGKTPKQLVSTGVTPQVLHSQVVYPQVGQGGLGQGDNRIQSHYPQAQRYNLAIIIENIDGRFAVQYANQISDWFETKAAAIFAYRINHEKHQQTYTTDQQNSYAAKSNAQI